MYYIQGDYKHDININSRHKSILLRYYISIQENETIINIIVGPMLYNYYCAVNLRLVLCVILSSNRTDEGVDEDDPLEPQMC